MKLILFLFFVLSSSAWAAYPNYTVCPSTCDFNTLQGAVNDIGVNHAVPAVPVTITISGSWASADTAQVNITGITTTSSNTLTISTTGSAVNGGKLPTGSGGYWLKPASGDAITVNDPYVTINGLAFDMSTSGGNAITNAEYNPNQTYINNFFKVTAGNAINFTNDQPRGANYLYNNVCYGNSSAQYTICAGMDGGGDGSTIMYIYNNTAYGMGQAYDLNNGGSGSTIYFSNNIASAAVTSDVHYGADATSGSNNICDLAAQCTVSPLTSGTNAATSYSSYYNSYTTGDFSLAAGSILIGGGTNLYGTFTQDITGTNRQSSGPWDVGAFASISPNNTTTIYSATIRNATIN